MSEEFEREHLDMGMLGNFTSAQSDDGEFTALAANQSNMTLNFTRDGMDNELLLQHPQHQIPYFNEISLIKTLVLGAMFVVALIGNTATLAQMYKMRRRKSTINFLILHLASADLIVTFFCNVTDAVWAATVQWYAGNALCKLAKFLQVFGLYLSTYITVIISLDRCLAILDPMSRNKAPRRVRLMVLGAYVISTLFSLPQTYIFRVKKGPFEEPFYQCVTYGAYTEAWHEKLYSCLSVFLMFIVPLTTMIAAYLLIFFTIASKSRDLRLEAEAANVDMLSRCPVRSQLFRKAKAKSLCMTALFVAAFIICWTPYYVIFILHTFSQANLNHKAALSIFCFGMANSMINPVIYGAFRLCKRQKRKSCTPLKYAAAPMHVSSSSDKSSSGNRNHHMLYKTQLAQYHDKRPHNKPKPGTATTTMPPMF